VDALKNMALLAQKFNPFNGTQLCIDEDPNLFFPEYYNDLEAVEKAKTICGNCWIKDECLEYAMQTSNLDGIWGGTTPRDRKRLRQSKTSTM